MVRAVHPGIGLRMGAGRVSCGVAAVDGLEGLQEGASLCLGAAFGGICGLAAALHGVHTACYGQA